jgi:hypothetical protein
MKIKRMKHESRLREKKMKQLEREVLDAQY